MNDLCEHGQHDHSQTFRTAEHLSEIAYGYCRCVGYDPRSLSEDEAQGMADWLSEELPTTCAPLIGEIAS